MRWRSQPPVPPAAFCVQVRSLGNFELLRVEYFLTIKFSEISLSRPFRVRFQRRSPGDTTLSELWQPTVLFKVGTLSYNWSTIGRTIKWLYLYNFQSPMYNSFS
jgi:hypothetical protein